MRVRSVSVETGPSFSVTDLGMLLVVLIWGGNLTINRWAFQSIAPLPFAALRFGLAAVLLVAILKISGGTLSVDRDLRWRMIWVGLVGNTCYQLLFQFGLSLTTAANTALLVSTSPLWLALIGLVRGTERLSRVVWAGIGLSLIGIALVLAGRGVAISSETLVGDGLVLGSAFCWSIYAIGARRLLARYSALKVTTMTMLSGTPALVLAGIPGLLSLSWAGVPTLGWVALLYSSVLSLVVAYVIWNGSVGRVGAIRTSIYGNLVPVVGVLIAWLFGGERITVPQIVGAAAILAGLALTRRRETGRQGDKVTR